MAIHRHPTSEILKVPFAYLRKNGHSPEVYIDDTYLQGDSPEDCERNIHNTAKLLWDLGFSIHPDSCIARSKVWSTVLSPSRAL